MDKQEAQIFYKQKFYEKWGNYDNYLEWKKKQPKLQKLPKKGIKFFKIKMMHCKNCYSICEAVEFYQFISNKHFELIGCVGWNCNQCGLKEIIKT